MNDADDKVKTLVLTSDMTNGRIRNWLNKHKNQSHIRLMNPETEIVMKSNGDELHMDVHITDKNVTLSDITVDELLEAVRG